MSLCARCILTFHRILEEMKDVVTIPGILFLTTRARLLRLLRRIVEGASKQFYVSTL
jgi:hypothetical protein